jgi:hypothetical protein
MNKRLETEFGEDMTEKRGWHWALTSFATRNNPLYIQAVNFTE